MTAYKVNEPEVSFEAEPGEVLVINLDSGLYFVLEGLAAQVWDWLVAGAALDSISATLTEVYPDQPSIDTDIRIFVDDLERQRLIVPTDQAQSVDLQHTSLNGYAAPVLKEQSDAQQFVGLKPMLGDTRFKLATQDIAHEVYDDEALVLDMNRGIYYSLQGAARLVWLGIQAGASINETVDLILRSYEGKRIDVEDGIRQFARQLLDEELILIDDQAQSGAELPTDMASEPLAFEVPTFEKYTDMQSLLLLDPIHDVEAEAGWPRTSGDD